MQRYVSLFLIILFVLPAAAQPRKKVGLVLSGGGAKGVAHVGALKVIEEAGIPIDYIAGTSMGAIVGGLYAIGYTSHQLDSMIKNQDWAYLITDATRRSIKTFAEKEEDARYVVTLPFIKTPREVIPDGIIKGQNIEALFTALTIGYHDSIDFNRLPIPYACVAVDLVEGREVVFHDGKLPQVMRASMAIPAAFTPVRMDSMVLVDGGLINNFPVDVARQMGAEIIIGVDVQNDPKEDERVVTVTDMVSQMASMLSRDKYAENLKDVDLHIKVDVEGFTAASFNQEALDTLTVRGEHAAQDAWDRLIALKQTIGIPPGYMPEPHGPYHFLSDDNPVFIRSISFSGIEGADARRLMRRCNIQQNSILTMSQLRGAVDELYATQIFTNVSYLLTKADDGYDLAFSFDDVRTNHFRFGLRFDWEEVASVLLNANYHFRSKIPTTGAVTARFGKRSGVRLDYTVYPNPLRFFNAAYSFEYNDINIYRKGRREYNATFDRHLGEIGYSNIFNQNLKVGAGLRYEYFNYKDFLYNSSQNELNIASEGFFSYYALLHYETMDMKTYPTRGTSLQADAALYTDNMVSYNGHSPFAALSLWWKTVYSVSDRVAIIPSAYGRVLLGQDAPYPYFNAVGGSVPGRYVPQQIPFEGINYMEIVENSLFVANLRLRHKFGRNHYVYLTLNYGLTAGDLSNIFDGRQLFGGGLTYGYDSLFGPIEASFNLSNSTRQLGFYLNIGYTF